MFKRAALYFLAKLFPAIISLLVIMTYTRILSPSDYGVYSLTLILGITIFSVMGNWVVISLGRYLPSSSKEEEVKLLSTSLTILSLISILVVVVFYILGHYKEKIGISVVYPFVGLIFFGAAIKELGLKTSNSKGFHKKYATILLSSNLILLGVGFSLWKIGLGVNGLLIGAILGMCITVFYVKNFFNEVTWKSWDSVSVRKMVKYGLPLSFLYLFGVIISFSDRFFIDFLKSGEEAGIYSAAYDLTQYFLGIIGAIVHLAVFPTLVKVFEEKGSKQAKVELEKSFKLLIFFIFPAIVGFTCLSSELSQFFLGRAFSGAEILFPWLALGVGIASLKSYYFDYAFQLAQATWLQVVPVLIAGVINLILNYFMIPSFGSLGAAYATLIAYTIYTILSSYIGRRVFEMPSLPYSFILKVAVSSIGMGLLVKEVNFNNLYFAISIKLVVGLFSYALFSSLLNVRIVRDTIKEYYLINFYKNSK